MKNFVSYFFYKKRKRNLSLLTSGSSRDTFWTCNCQYCYSLDAVTLEMLGFNESEGHSVPFLQLSSCQDVFKVLMLKKSGNFDSC